MMIMPDPGVLNVMIRDRQRNLRAHRHTSAATRYGLRVRLGRTMITVGRSLSGERVEQPARPTALSRAV